MKESGTPTVVVSFDRVFGEALAAGLSRRGLEATYLHPDDTASTVSGVVVLDVSDAHQSRGVDLRGLVGEETVRLVRVGADVGSCLGQLPVDAAVEIESDIECVAAAAGGASLRWGRQHLDRNAQARPGRVVLTNRERQLVRELLAGNTVAEISTLWSVSEGTVRKHLQNVFGKIGVHSRAEAVAWALHAGLTPAEQVGEIVS